MILTNQTSLHDENPPSYSSQFDKGVISQGLRILDYVWIGFEQNVQFALMICCNKHSQIQRLLKFICNFFWPICCTSFSTRSNLWLCPYAPSPLTRALPQKGLTSSDPETFSLIIFSFICITFAPIFLNHHPRFGRYMYLKVVDSIFIGFIYSTCSFASKNFFLALYDGTIDMLIQCSQQASTFRFEICSAMCNKQIKTKMCMSFQ